MKPKMALEAQRLHRARTRMKEEVTPALGRCSRTSVRVHGQNQSRARVCTPMQASVRRSVCLSQEVEQGRSHQGQLKRQQWVALVMTLMQSRTRTSRPLTQGRSILSIGCSQTRRKPGRRMTSWWASGFWTSQAYGHGWCWFLTNLVAASTSTRPRHGCLRRQSA